MHKSSLPLFLGEWLPQIETEIHAVLNNDESAIAAHYGMMRYHLGWADEQLRPVRFPSGKRLRPILCLLACAEVGGDPFRAIPAAAAIELLHNFSLIHDDIEDGDEARRHRPTVWKVWGIPQAINAGDGMFTLAFAAIQRLRQRDVSNSTTLSALQTFTQTCLELTEGQHLDMSFEQRNEVTVREYMRMIQGKTAALVGACTSIGARIGSTSSSGANEEQCDAFKRFGEAVGISFQIRDDILGIWGDPQVTGKAAGNDVLRKKKSLPMLYALNHPGLGEQFETLLGDDFGPKTLPHALEILEKSGARAEAEQAAQAWHDASIAALQQAIGTQASDSAIWSLAESLLNRQS